MNNYDQIIRYRGNRKVNERAYAKREDRAQELSRLRHRHSIPAGQDFHCLPWSVKERIIAAADEYGYRQPKNANGSRARYFYAMMERSYRS